MQKAPPVRRALLVLLETSGRLTVDGRSGQRYRSSFASSQVEGEVVSVALVHHFHTQVRTVQHVCPGANHLTLRVDDGLVEVEPVQVERHGADAQGGAPDADDGPCTQEEVQGAAVVEGRILEDQAAEVAVSCHDVVGLFFLTELVAVVLRLVLGGRRIIKKKNQRTVHGGEQATTEDTRHTELMEGVHQDIVLSLEHQHEVEGPRDTEGHAIGEGALADGVDEEYCGCSCHRCRVSNTDPRTHAEAVGQFTLTTHVAENADEEVEDHQLVRATVVEPLIEGSSFPDGVEVEATGVGRRHNCTRDDVVAVDEGASDGLTDTIDVNGRSRDESDDEADGGREQGRNHQDAEPAYIEAVVGAGDPIT